MLRDEKHRVRYKRDTGKGSGAFIRPCSYLKYPQNAPSPKYLDALSQMIANIIISRKETGAI